MRFSSFLANQKARNAIVGAENLLTSHIQSAPAHGIIVKYIEDITRWRGEDMNFMFEWQEQYLTSSVIFYRQKLCNVIFAYLNNLFLCIADSGFFILAVL